MRKVIKRAVFETELRGYDQAVTDCRTMTNPPGTATVAKLDTVYEELAGLHMRRAVAEGNVFPSTHWARGEAGLRLREVVESTIGVAA